LGHAALHCQFPWRFMQVRMVEVTEKNAVVDVGAAGRMIV
jgi:hypothetical protein